MQRQTSKAHKREQEETKTEDEEKKLRVWGSLTLRGKAVDLQLALDPGFSTAHTAPFVNGIVRRADCHDLDVVSGSWQSTEVATLG